jgi:predicted GIY-YIG superfamily endonuclease
MHYVDLLQSKTFEAQRYVGITGDLKRRLAEHNAGKSSHTSKYADTIRPFDERMPFTVVMVNWRTRRAVTASRRVRSPLTTPDMPASFSGRTPLL